jgi:Dolichyl-phosphate-mannose-protein mannosyltransferase
MPVVDETARPSAPPERRVEDPRSGPRRRALVLLLVALLSAAFALRVVGVDHGLPFVYNGDEATHFVSRTVEMLETRNLNPDYFVNPPAFTYSLLPVLAVRFGGGEETAEAFRTDPGAVFLTARVTVALLGTLAVWLVYLAGARLFDRRAGLLAAVTLTFAFLPVSWAHEATNDVPALAAVAFAFWATAGVVRDGRRPDYLLAGAGIGLAVATKYTAGIVLVALLAAGYARSRDDRRAALVGLGLAAVAAVVVFFVANPYALLDSSRFFDQLTELSVTPEGESKFGQSADNGFLYYLWALTWGLGWAPLAAAVVGAVALIRGNRMLAVTVVLPIILYLLFMSIHERFFGRWLLPIFPILCVLAGYGGAVVARWFVGRGLHAWAAWGAVAVALLAQGAVHAVHTDIVLVREDTRNQTRDWMLANVPREEAVLPIRVAPRRWFRDEEGEAAWRRFPLYRVVQEGNLERTTGLETTSNAPFLQPAMIDVLERLGVCWVVTASTHYDRVFVEEENVPQAAAFYRALDDRAELAYAASPYDEGLGPVPFNFDWVSNYYPFPFHRPGPDTRVYRLVDGACAQDEA